MWNVCWLHKQQYSLWCQLFGKTQTPLEWKLRNFHFKSSIPYFFYPQIWILVFTVSITGSSVLIVKMYNKWQQSPIFSILLKHQLGKFHFQLSLFVRVNTFLKVDSRRFLFLLNFQILIKYFFIKHFLLNVIHYYDKEKMKIKYLINN